MPVSVAMATFLGLAAAGSGVLSAVLLFYGSQDVPFELQSWGGQTEPETRFRKTRKRLARLGFVFLAGAFVLQSAAMLASHPSYSLTFQTCSPSSSLAEFVSQGLTGMPFFPTGADLRCWKAFHHLCLSVFIRGNLLF
jgi:hypothetical protein